MLPKGKVVGLAITFSHLVLHNHHSFLFVAVISHHDPGHLEKSLSGLTVSEGGAGQRAGRPRTAAVAESLRFDL